ncbi:hypothetical protein BpHYR1_017923 [Brachionus plicatilis]|uniref:Uncharacterized protein n=1 Tax=Brachionus plicatilis TaxID=10195 RepID=A0A3M7SWX6_BRAPC|nr:hypothetical protein BpHYR1_017923 [Brachionus plicatilis]
MSYPKNKYTMSITINFSTTKCVQFIFIRCVSATVAFSINSIESNNLTDSRVLMFTRYTLEQY